MTDQPNDASPPEEIRLLEAHAATTWPSENVEPLHGWQLGFARGVTRRANSVLPLDWSASADLSSALAEAERRYRARRLRPCFKVTGAARPAGLDARLEAHGYAREGASLVLVADAERVAAQGAEPSGVELLHRIDRDWVSVSWPDSMAALDREVRLAMVDRIDPAPIFALGRRAGRVCGGAFAVADRGWVGITAVRTDPAYRRQGVARDLMAALARWALTQEVRSLYLQVEADNLPAVALYRGAGFRVAYRYHYRTLPRQATR